MGTRADFYVGRGPEALWIGSIGWDGYPQGVFDVVSPIDNDHRDRIAVVDGTQPMAGWVESVARFFKGRDDVTEPEMGWPWPWNDSCTTDWAYAWDDGVIYASCFGSQWVTITETLAAEAAYDQNDDEEAYEAIVHREPKVDFPDMTKIQNVRWDKGSGLIVLRVPEEGS